MEQKRFTVVDKKKQGVRNIYAVMDREDGEVRIMTTKALGMYVEQGLVEGYGGTSKRIYKLKGREKKALRSLLNSRGDLDKKVVNHYKQYIRGIEISEGSLSQLEEVVEYNERVEPEGRHSQATLHSPAEEPVVDYMDMPEGLRVGFRLHILEADVYRDLERKGYTVTPSDIEYISEGRQSVLYNFWYDIISSYIEQSDEDVRGVMEYLYELEDKGHIKNVELDIRREGDGYFSYTTGDLEVDEDKVVERAFERLGF